jgi:hypothetical protein
MHVLMYLEREKTNLKTKSYIYGVEYKKWYLTLLF